MSLDHGKANRPVPVPIGPRNDRALVRVGTVFAVVIALGLFGRLVPSPAARPIASPAFDPARPTTVERVRLATPNRDVVFFRTTEIAVRGTAERGIDAVEVAVAVDGRIIGEATLDVRGGGFAGVVSVIPPAVRTAGILEVRAADGAGAPLAEVRFAVEAGAVVLPVGPSGLQATAGEPFLVDVLVYGEASEIRALLTNEGTLIAQGSVALRPRREGAPTPRTIGLRMEIADERLPGRGRLHLIALDADGHEIDHIDSNVQLSNR